MAEAEEIKEVIQVTTVHQKVESEREEEEMMATATKDLCLIQWPPPERIEIYLFFVNFFVTFLLTFFVEVETIAKHLPFDCLIIITFWFVELSDIYEQFELRYFFIFHLLLDGPT